MKKIQAATLWMWIFLFTIVPALQSCLDDDNDTPLFTVGTIQTLSQDEGDFYVLLDDNSKLFPGDMSSLRGYKATDGQRAFVFFDELPEEMPGYDYNAKIRWIQDILTKDIYNMPAEKEDSIGDDRINITQMWLTRKDYLNIECQFMSSENTEKKHMLSLVINEASTDGNDNPDYLTLEFRHNANEDSPLGVNVRVNTIYGGEKFYQIDFKSAEESTTSRSGHTPSSDLIR